jgi:hypothetical protein
VGPGELFIVEPPVANAQYIIGADVAEGATFGTAKQSGDLSTLCILRRNGLHLDQVAEASYRTENFVFGQIIAALGKWYNFAHVNVERNLAHGVIAGLRSSQYPQERWYVPPIQASTLEVQSSSWFFHKNAATQKVLLDTLLSYMDPQAPRLRVWSHRCIQEIASLQTDSNGRINTNGKDFVIALSMAVIVDATTEFDITDVEKAPVKKIAPYGVDVEQWNDLHGIKVHRPQASDEAPTWEGDNDAFGWTPDWGDAH